MFDGASRRVVAAPFAVSIVVVLPITLLGALFVEIGPDFGLDRADLGLLAGVFLGVSIVVSPATGPLSERWGAPRALTAAAALAALACGGVAVAARSAVSLLPWLAVAGVANSISQPATALYILETVPRRRHGFAFGLKQATSPLGTLVAGLALPTVALTAGWRWAFAAASSLALTAAAAVPKSPRREPAHRPRAGARLRSRGSVVLLAVLIALGVGAASVLGLFLIDAAVDAGFSRPAAGWLQVVGSVGGVIARLVTGWLADSHSTGLPLITAMLAAGAAGYVLLGVGGTAAIIAGTVLAFSMGWGWVGVFFFAVVRLHPEAPGAATGIAQIGDFGGSLAGPILFGSLAAGHGYRAAWFAAAALAMLATTVSAIAVAWRPAVNHDQPFAPVIGALTTQEEHNG